jgi:hypothetical protein
MVFKKMPLVPLKIWTLNDLEKEVKLFLSDARIVNLGRSIYFNLKSNMAVLYVSFYFQFGVSSLILKQLILIQCI